MFLSLIMTGINGKVLKNPNSKTVILFDSSYSLDTLKEIIETGVVV